MKVGDVVEWKDAIKKVKYVGIVVSRVGHKKSTAWPDIKVLTSDGLLNVASWQCRILHENR